MPPFGLLKRRERHSECNLACASKAFDFAGGLTN
jgi:hypothetical protein